MTILPEHASANESTAELLQQWSRLVLQRTHQRLSDLSLNLQQNAIRIQGIAPSYYVKQLALEGLMMCIDRQHLTIHDSIQVKNY